MAVERNREVRAGGVSDSFIAQLGQAFVVGREVFVTGLRAGRGPVDFRLARLDGTTHPTTDQLDALFQVWTRINRTLTPEEARVVVFAEALK